MSEQAPFSTPIERIPGLKQVEGREWWLWGFAVAVTLCLTLAILSLTFFGFHGATDKVYALNLKEWVRGLAALVLLFDTYTIYQHLQLQRIRRQLAERDRLFQLISENAADMIGLVDSRGKRLYNSPAYTKVLGYSAEELSATSPVEQIHPEDRDRVLEAAEKARLTGRGDCLEYRIRHKDGTWRVLESTANAILGATGEVEGLVIVNRDITDRKHAEEMLAHQTFHDTLTNLPNRLLFLDRIGRAMAVARRYATQKFAILYIDIDGFKVFNDSLGHPAGDALLVQISQRLTACLRRVDTISRQRKNETDEPVIGDNTLARPGGDEFAVLAEELRNPSDAVRVAERIQKKLAAPFEVNGQQIVITASIGIAIGSRSTTDAQNLLRDAEIAMYRAKHGGKARCEVFDNKMHASALLRLQLETDMRKGLDSGEFHVHYQPVVSVGSGRIVGFEALSRWYRPYGMVMPQDFIPVANETGMILTINRELLLLASQQVRRWQQKYALSPPLFLSVNITPKQFAQPDLSRQIGQLIRQSGIDPHCVNLEITETIAMSDAERSGIVLSELKSLGVHLDIDDFGTGYSSLSRLQHLPIDTLKIDRAFISRMDSDDDTHEIVRIIIMLAHNLGMKVVAEGVETQAQLDLLQKLGCEFAQGYLFSKPAEPEVIEKLLQSNLSVGTTLSRVRAAHSGV
jgi:diguanylate cyclase (GGDEF)-like protein/PAS domain S-box-containing protein